MSDASNPSGRTGLVIKHAKAKYPRPARPVQTIAKPLKPASFELLEIRSHRALIAKQREIAARVNASPDLALMLLINPVLAFEQMGVKLSPEIAHHILHAIQRCLDGTRAQPKWTSFGIDQTIVRDPVDIVAPVHILIP